MNPKFIRECAFHSLKNSARISLVAAVVLVTGCAGVRVTDTGSRGLFQDHEAPKAAETSKSVVKEEGLASHPTSTKPSPTAADFKFQWPIREGSVTSFFGSRKRDFHEGIDIRAPRGTTIFSVLEGDVIYSSRRIHGYGNMIVVRHKDGLATVYAHNRKNLVKVGQKVNAGQAIALVGSTGKATGPHLHFEVRRDELPVDPLLYLPQLQDSNVSAAR